MTFANGDRFKQTTAGLIPSDWEVTTIGDEFDVSAGGDWDAENSSTLRDGDHQYPVVANALSRGAVQGYCRYFTIPGDSFTITGRGAIGKAVYRPYPFVPIVRLLALVPRRGSSPEFFTAYINSRVNFSIESTGVPQLTAPQVRPYPVARPSSCEQNAIASLLADVEDLVLALERMIAKKQAIQQGMMQQLLTGETRLPGFHGPWKTTELGDHFEITSSKRIFQKDWRKSGVPFYRARELAILGATGHVDNELFIDRKLFEEYKQSHGAPSAGDFLVTGVGTLGKTYVVKPGDEFYFKDGNIIWLKASLSVDSDFLNFLYSTPIITSQIESESSGTTVGTYTITSAKKTRISLPHIDEQRAIVAVLGSAAESLNLSAARLAKARAIKQGMMQALLTGRTRLPIGESAV